MAATDPGSSGDSLADRLSEIYAQSGFNSYRALARKSGLTASTIGNLLRGKGRPRQSSVKAFLRACRTDEQTIAALSGAANRIQARHAEPLFRGWVMGPAADRGARDHFLDKATARRNVGQGGDMFRGRANALRKIQDWLTDAEHPGVPLVVTGEPGAGKSSTLARAAGEIVAGQGLTALAFRAADATNADLIRAIGGGVGATDPDSLTMVVETLRARTPGRPVMVIVDGLDEAGTARDRAETARTVTALAAVPDIRVVVATRPRAPRSSSLLSALGIRSKDAHNLIDLDREGFADEPGLREAAFALLCQEGAIDPGPSGAAWKVYRDDQKLGRRLARMIAERANGNYLVAALAAHPLSMMPDPVDPDLPDFDESTIPVGVTDVLEKYLGALEPAWRVRVVDLLGALAYARGPGLTDDLWLRFASAIGEPAGRNDLARLRDSAAVDYLIETVAGADGPITRLYHGALATELLAGRHRPRDEKLLFASLLPTEGEDWSDASDYVRHYAADHAVKCGQLPRLLRDTRYLLYADLTRLTSHLESRADPVALVIRRAATRSTRLPPERRAGLLALTAAHLGLGDIQRDLIRSGAPTMPVLWAHGLGDAHQELIGHTDAVAAAALGRVNGRDVIASGGFDGTVRLWDALSGTVDRTIEADEMWVLAVAFGTLGDTEMIVSGGRDGTVRRWDAATGKALGPPLLGHYGPVQAVVTAHIGGRDVIVSGGWDGTVRIWDAGSGEVVRMMKTEGDRGAERWWDDGALPWDSRDAGITALAVGPTPVGQPSIIAGTRRNVVLCWDATRPSSRARTLIKHESWVTSVAVGRIDDEAVVVSGGRDGAVRRWTGSGAVRTLAGSPDGVESVALGDIDGEPVVVFGGMDNTVHLYATRRDQVIRSFTGHTDWVNAVAFGNFGHGQRIVSAGADTTVRIWDVRATPDASARGHREAVMDLATGEVAGTAVVASVSLDRTIRLSDLADGTTLGRPITLRGFGESVAMWTHNRRTFLAGGATQGLGIWTVTARSHRLVREVGFEPWWRADSIVVVRTGDHPSVVVGSGDGDLRIWSGDLDAEPGPQFKIGPPQSLAAVAVHRIGARDVLVSGQWNDSTVRQWDLSSGTPIGPPMDGHGIGVNAVATSILNGLPIIVSAGEDQTVRVWDAIRNAPLGPVLTGHAGPVKDVIVADLEERLVAVSTGDDRTVRIWDLGTGRELEIIDLLAPGQAVRMSVDGSMLCVGSGSAVCTFLWPGGSRLG